MLQDVEVRVLSWAPKSFEKPRNMNMLRGFYFSAHPDTPLKVRGGMYVADRSHIFKRRLQQNLRPLCVCWRRYVGLAIGSPTLERPKAEFSGFAQGDGLVAPPDFVSGIGTLFPITPCGRSSL